jgi:F420-dependent oxidoreductase-like protein
MLDVAIMVEGQDGLNWDRWRRITALAEDLGFAGLFRSDHFTNPQGPQRDSLELWISFAWLASHTDRIEFGPMVSPLSFRNPVVTAWSAAAVDDLSRGRFWLGLGAGWQEREHRSFGFDLLDLDGRFDRFEEGIRVVKALLSSDEPVNFGGQFFHLEDALLLPRPARAGGPPIVIGGNGVRRTLPLAARYADEWNAVFATPQQFAELNRSLDDFIGAAGRQKSDVRRTLMHRVTTAKSDATLERKLATADVENLRKRGAMIGSPDEIVEALNRFNVAGVQRVMAQMMDLDDLETFEIVAERVLPQLN